MASVSFALNPGGPSGLCAALAPGDGFKGDRYAKHAGVRDILRVLYELSSREKQ